MQRKSGTIPARFAILGIIFACGCQRTLPPEPPPAHQGKTVRVLCPDDMRDLIATQSRPWQARQSAQVEIQTYTPNDGPGRPQFSPAGSADLWVFPPADLPRLAATGQLTRIPDEFSQRGGEFAWDRLLPLYREHLVLWDRVAYALPLVGEAPVCVYRADLVDSPQWQSKYAGWQKKHPPTDSQKKSAGAAPLPLRAPASWDEFARQAEFYRDEHPSGKPGPSLPALPASEDGVDRLFLTIASSYARRAVRQDEQRGPDYLDEVFSFLFDQKTGAPRIGSPGFARALAVMNRLQACRPAQPAARPETALLGGEAALGIVEASVLARLQQTPQRDRFGVCTVPGGQSYFTREGKEVPAKQGTNRVPYLGGAGWLAAVPRSAAQPEAAADLLADLAGPRRSAQVAQEPRWGGGATRTDVLLRERWDAFDLDTQRTNALREVLTWTLLQNGLENPVFVLRLPDRTAFRDALVAGVRRSLLERVDPAEALRAVDRRWQALIDNRGAAAHRRNYRVGLGLLAN